MTQKEFALSFENVSGAEANRLIQELQDVAERVDASIKAQRRRKNSETQDFGTTLVLIFGTPFALALANAICVFMKRHSGATISIEANGTVLGTNLNSEDAARIAEAFRKSA